MNWTMRSIWKTTRSDRPSLSLKIVLMRSLSNLTGKIRWLATGMLLTKRRQPQSRLEELETPMLQAKSHINLTSLQHRRPVLYPVPPKPVARKSKRDQSGTNQLPHPRKISHQPRIVWPPRLLQKCYVITQIYVVFTPKTRSRCCSRKKPSATSLQ